VCLSPLASLACACVWASRRSAPSKWAPLRSAPSRWASARIALSRWAVGEVRPRYSPSLREPTKHSQGGLHVGGDAKAGDARVSGRRRIVFTHKGAEYFDDDAVIPFRVHGNALQGVNATESYSQLVHFPRVGRRPLFCGVTGPRASPSTAQVVDQGPIASPGDLKAELVPTAMGAASSTSGRGRSGRRPGKQPGQPGNRERRCARWSTRTRWWSASRRAARIVAASWFPVRVAARQLCDECRVGSRRAPAGPSRPERRLGGWSGWLRLIG